MNRRFPLMVDWQYARDNPEYPRSVPWSFVAPHYAQAQANHDQTLERLAQRGGLDPSEMVAIVDGVAYRYIRTDEASLEAANARLLELLAKHEAEARKQEHS